MMRNSTQRGNKDIVDVEAVFEGWKEDICQHSKTKLLWAGIIQTWKPTETKLPTSPHYQKHPEKERKKERESYDCSPGPNRKIAQGNWPAFSCFTWGRGACWNVCTCLLNPSNNWLHAGELKLKCTIRPTLSCFQPITSTQAVVA